MLDFLSSELLLSLFRMLKLTTKSDVSSITGAPEILGGRVKTLVW